MHPDLGTAAAAVVRGGVQSLPLAFTAIAKSLCCISAFRVSMLALLLHCSAGWHAPGALTTARLHMGSKPHVARVSALRSVATADSLNPAPAEDRFATAVGYDAWAAELDYKEFRKEVHTLGQTLIRGQGEADLKHLRKMIMWSNMCGAVGLATMWMAHPLGRLMSIVGLSTWTCTRWTMIGHHISHGGYNNVDDAKVEYEWGQGTGRVHASGFGVGSVYRRVRDWFDWMLPEAWNVEHNNLHHYRLSESGDPDLVERNLELMREIKLPRAVKYVAVAFLAAMWKW